MDSGITRKDFLKASGGALAGLYVLGAIDAAHARPGGPPGQLTPEDGYDLWLRYRPIKNRQLRDEYRRLASKVVVEGDTQILDSTRDELERGLSGLLGEGQRQGGTVIVGTPETSRTIREEVSEGELRELGPEGYMIRSGRTLGKGSGGERILIASKGERGVLYGAFHLLRLMQTEQKINDLDVRERPVNPLRMHNHWDNINDSVERGYAGGSIFEWSVPGLSPRVRDYGRALASLGLTHTVVNNVNANPQFLTPGMLEEVTLVADELRPWGVTLMLSANFAAPLALRELDTADPFDPEVRAWWRRKADEIYEAIPDFGGFLVKANSEGQPGPIDYGRTHADGANMLAEALRPHGGIIVWRAFVYDPSDGDVSTDAYNTFAPLDGKFADNVLVQAKYGPNDFHVGEPVHPLFGGLPNTNMTLELQVTQEHTGHSTHLCYLVPWWKKILGFDTHAKGPGTTVARVVDGSAFGYTRAGMAGVSNFGDDRNWTGHHLAAANAYGYGRLAWNPDLSAEQITDEWVAMTFGNHPSLRKPLATMLLGSYATFVDYTSPLGIGNLVAASGAHFDPDPEDGRHSDAETVGNDRTVATGTGFTGLYHAPWNRIYESLDTVPDEHVLFMHRVPYEHRLQSGKTVIQHIYDSHFEGLENAVHDQHDTWDRLRRWVDERRHSEVQESFDAQVAHATLWRDTIVAYFFRLSRILDERRSWVQVELADPDAALLLGGWPNRVPLEIGNASRTEREVTARLSVPEGWTAGAVSEPVPSKEFEVVNLPVAPAPVGTITSVSADVQADDLPVLGGTDTTLVVTPTPQLCLYALDGGSASSPLLEGYQRLAPESAWDPERGFGWVGGSPESRDRGAALDVLRRDFVNARPARTLRLALPPGAHPAYLLVGDVVGSYPTIVTVDGTELARSRQLAGYEFEWLTFTLDGGPSGRTVDLVLSSVNNEYWHLNALAVVDPTAKLAPVVIAGASPKELLLVPGEPSDVTFELRNTTNGNVTVRPTAAVPDGYTATVEPAEVVVPASGDAEVAVTVVRDEGTDAGKLTFTVGEESATVGLKAVDNWVRIATMSASSTTGVSSPSLANDGITDSEQWGNARGGWNDGTPGAFPDTLTATWERPVTLSRVRVFTLDSRQYPAASWGLRDYDVQVKVDGAWQTVAEVRGNVTGVVESTFPAASGTALQLVIRDTNDHRYSRVMELEAYR
jgi:alpha-glucuronidase